MTIREVAESLGLKVRTIREWIRKGKIQCEKISGRWYIPQTELDREEIQLNADKGRKHSRRIKEGRTVGVREQGRQNPEKPIQREKRKGK